MEPPDAAEPDFHEPPLLQRMLKSLSGESLNSFEVFGSDTVLNSSLIHRVLTLCTTKFVRIPLMTTRRGFMH